MFVMIPYINTQREERTGNTGLLLGCGENCVLNAEKRQIGIGGGGVYGAPVTQTHFY